MKGEKEGISCFATLRLGFPAKKDAAAAYQSLLQETDFSHRGGSKVIQKGNLVIVDIKADDPVSLRASINSYLRLMHIIKSVEQDLE